LRFVDVLHSNNTVMRLEYVFANIFELKRVQNTPEI